MKNRFIFDEASPSDSPELLDIIEDVYFKGNISLLYTRQKDPFKSFKREGEEVSIIVCRDTQCKKIVGFGVVAYNKLYLAGNPVEAGYLFGFRVRKDYLHIYTGVHKGYAYMIELHKQRNTKIFYTTILSEN